MNNINFPIVIKDKKKIKLKILIYASVFLIIIEGVFFYPKDENNIKVFLFFGIPFIIWFIAIIYSNFHIKPFKIAGNIELYENEIQVVGEKIQFNDIIKLIIYYDSYFGKSLNLSGLAVSQGGANRIIIITRNNKQISFNFYLKDKTSLIILKEFIQQLIEQQVNVYYFSGRKKIYPKREKSQLT